jgi:D-alanine-D-alanine ligase
MRIGLTYDLRDDYRRLGYSEEQTAEFDSLETIDALDRTLSSLGCRVERIGSVASLMARLLEGARWDLVFNIAEGLRGFGREAQVPALLDAFDIPYTFSDPLVLCVALHKGMAKRVARDLGVPTPDFAVVEKVGGVAAVSLPFPAFAKPIAGGTSVGIAASSKVMTQAALRTVCADLLQRFQQPVLVETFLPGREVTVGIVGTGPRARILGVMEVLLQPEAEPEVYSYTNKAHYEGKVEYRVIRDDLASEAADVALRMWNGLGCRDGGRVDLRCDDRGRAHFIEVNPLAGLHPRISDLVVICQHLRVPYETLIETILQSAVERVREREARALPPTLPAATPQRV